MKPGKAYPFLKAFLDASIEAAPNWTKAPAKFFSSLAEYQKNKSEEENKQLEREVQGISQGDLHELIRETGHTQNELIESIAVSVSTIPVILQTLQYRFDQSDARQEEIITLINEVLDQRQPEQRYLKHFSGNISTFTGRENDLRELGRLLDEKGTVLLLNGLGGIGKTTLAMEYVKRNQHNYNSVIWLDYLDSLRSAFLKFSEFFGFEGTAEEVCSRILAEISRYDGDNLLIIDNFHKIRKDDKEGEGKTYEEELDRLRFLPHNFTKLITSREEIPGDFFVTKHLDELPPGDAEALFRAHYTQPFDPDVLSVFLELTGYHTLTIELAAKTLERSLGRYTLEDICSIFKEKTFNTPGGDIVAEVNYKRRMKINTFMEELFVIADIPAEQLAILKQFAVLPPIEIEEKIIPDMFGIEEDCFAYFSSCYEGLIQGGWLNRTEKGIKCHRIIRQVIANREKPDYESLKNIIEYIGTQLSCEPGDIPQLKARWIEYGVQLLNTLGVKNEHLADLASNLAVRYLDMGNFNNALRFAEKSTEILDKVLPDNHPVLARSYNNLAGIYKNLSDLENAIKFAEKSIEIREKVLSDDHPGLAVSYNNLAMIYYDMGNLEKALTFQKKDLSITEKVLTDNHPDLAQSYNNIAMIYLDLGDIGNALTCANKSLNIRKKNLPNNHPDLAQSYNNIAQIYKILGDLDIALTFTEKALNIYELSLPQNHPNIAVAYGNIAGIYHVMGNHEKAREYEQKAEVVRKMRTE